MDRLNRSYNEKRNFIRMKVDTPAEILLADGKRVKGICRDLSGSGLLLETKSELELGQEVRVQLSSHHVNSPMLRARAIVTRSQLSRTKSFILGLEIQEMLD